MRRFAPALVLVPLAACADVPKLEVDGLAAAEAAPYPALLPLTPALAAADTPPALTAAEAEALAARAGGIGAVPGAGAAADAARLTRLRARAAILRGPLETDAEITAMRAALAAL